MMRERKRRGHQKEEARKREREREGERERERKDVSKAVGERRGVTVVFDKISERARKRG